MRHGSEGRTALLSALLSTLLSTHLLLAAAPACAQDAAPASAAGIKRTPVYRGPVAAAETEGRRWLFGPGRDGA
jgi:hypothetical protein